MGNRQPHPIEPIKPRIAGKLSPNDVAAIIQAKCKAFPERTKTKSKHYIFFTPHAWDSFRASVNYGKWVAENELESQYFLEGYYFIDKNKISSTVVTNVITPYSASQGRASAQLYSESFNTYKIIEQKEEELTKYASAGKDIDLKCIINPFYNDFGAPIRVGFGHTHPNIGVFFSSVDKTSVFASPSEPWITMVTDPRRKELLAAIGTEMEISPIILFNQKETKPEKSEPKTILPKETVPNASTPPSFKDEFIECLTLINDQLLLGSSVKIKMSGKLPGKLNFKGSFFVPKRRKKGKRR